jgi:hypothetical protein
MDQLLLDTLARLENKVDAVATDVKAIQLEQAEMRGVRKTLVYLAGAVGSLGGAIAGLAGHHLGAW